MSVMRRSELIQRQRERNSRRGKASQAARKSARLAAALERGPVRPVEPTLLFELATWNPLRNAGHYLELWHHPGDGNGRLRVYLDGERWRNGWSVSRFSRWLAQQIDRIREDWE